MKICGYDNLGNLLTGSMARKVMDAFGRVLSIIKDKSGKEHKLISRCDCQRIPDTNLLHELPKEKSHVLFSGYVYDADPLYLKNNKNVAIVKIKEPHSTKKTIIEIPISHLFYVDKKDNIQNQQPK